MFESDKTWFCQELTTEEAIKIRNELQTAIENNNHAEATQLFQQIKKYMKKRIEENYFLPIQKINTCFSKPEIRVNTGFIIMTINCILIELLFEIKNGFDASDEGDNHVIDAYLSILPQLDKNITSELARIFYKGIRCGITHQGQTKEYRQIIDNEEVLSYTALTFEEGFDNVFKKNGLYYLSNPETVFKRLKEEYKLYWMSISEKNYNDSDAIKLIEKYSKILEHIA